MSRISLWRGQEPKYKAVDPAKQKLKVYKCYFCGKEIKGYYGLRQHLRDHKTGFAKP